MEFVKKPLLCDRDVIQNDDINTYGFLVQEYLQEYRNIIDSKRWEPTGVKKIYKDESLLLMDSTVSIESPVNKTVDKVSCKTCHIGKDNKSGVGSSMKSVVTCHKCGKSSFKKNFKSNINGYNGELFKTLTCRGKGGTMGTRTRMGMRAPF